MDFLGFKSILRNEFKGFKGILRDFQGLKGIGMPRDFDGF